MSVVFVGLPGTGKTYLGKHLSKKMIQIEQDSFYVSGRCDTQSYLEEIEETIQHGNVVLCKNHHTKKSLDEVLEVLHLWRFKTPIRALKNKGIKSIYKDTPCLWFYFILTCRIALF